MTQEDKELLLKDLCMRLPYGVKVRGVFLNYNKDKDKIQYEECDKELNYEHLKRYESLKPYLRPMSSMTEEEKKDLLVTVVGNDGTKYFQVLLDGSISNITTIQDLNKFLMYWINFNKDTVTLYLNWLLKNHFDFHGLIPKSLAIEVNKSNNPYKD